MSLLRSASQAHAWLREQAGIYWCVHRTLRDLIVVMVVSLVLPGGRVDGLEVEGLLRQGPLVVSVTNFVDAHVDQVVWSILAKTSLTCL